MKKEIEIDIYERLNLCGYKIHAFLPPQMKLGD